MVPGKLLDRVCTAAKQMRDLPDIASQKSIRDHPFPALQES
jgi:hypothetical protein